MKNILDKIFSIKKERGFAHKIVYIFGIKLKFKTKSYGKKYQTPLTEALCDYIKENNIHEDYKNLVRDLDKESIDVVNKIIYRTIQQNDDENFYVSEDYSEAERERGELEKVREIKITDNCYAFQKYFLPEADCFTHSVFTFKQGLNLLNENSLNKLKNRDIIDVGGWIGDSAIVLSDYTNKAVYTFEPSNDNYEILQKTIKLNSPKNIIPVKLGLGSEDKTVLFSKNGSECKVITEDTNVSDKDFEKISITTLDSYVEQNNLDIGLIKVDIEGLEQDFLKGARKTIETQKPVLLLSIYHNPDDFFHIKPIIESWNLGYKFKIGKHVAEEPLIETMLIAETED